MNVNVAISHPAVVAFDGTKAFARILAGYASFGFTFEVVSDLTQDTIFGVEAASGSLADANVPGDFSAVVGINNCDQSTKVGDDVVVTIPKDTKAGTLIAATLPCIPNRFIRLVAKSGDSSNVKAVITYHGQGR